MFGRDSAFFLLRIFVFIFLFEGFIFYLQGYLFDYIYIEPFHIKAIFSFFFLVVIFSFILSYCQLSHFGWLSFFAYFLFLIINFSSISYHDPGPLFLSAFLYNFSLTIFLFLIVYFLLFSDTRRICFFDQSSFFIQLFSIFIILLSLYEYFSGQFIFGNLYKILSTNDIIKFDQIGGSHRLNSIFRSPITFSYVATLFGSFFLLSFLKNNSLFHFFIFTFFSFLVLLIKVRSGAVFLFSTIFYILFSRIFFSYYYVFFFFLFSLFSILFVVVGFYHSLPLLDPTNLLIRLDNWTIILDSFDNLSDILFGFGVVQNGSYGLHHTVIIDNLYLGILLSSGLIGFLIFLILVSALFFFSSSLSFYERLWFRSYFFGFLVAGFFENNMHSFYISFLPIIIVFSFSKLTFNK